MLELTLLGGMASNAASFKDSLEEQGVVIEGDNLATLIDNMRNRQNSGGVPSENAENWCSTSMLVEAGKRDMLVISLSGAHPN
jgi:hypothetical protein